MNYVAVAYRWGYLNGHQYFVYVGADKAKAIALAQAENQDRGGKYGCTVWEFTDEPDGQQDHKSVAYFRSSWGEDRPFHNYRIDMFERLGHAFHDYAEGTVWLPQDDDTLKGRDGKPMRVLKPHKMEPPQWVVDKKRETEEFYNAMREAQVNRTS